ncbi:LOW QUALITY PROTEIN: hypothetical protein Cgig2_023639 [Carnegiea gigantea]|uniref:Uncharacterized protein n=1 Tax=Carnegiea gigantea TaxID=171969 RepID=A0A9Q1KEM6_9CARY|nr:LOW QUALITY PROTEIN: hypothetical protein Cgig2_023639 [Carnegiea gigantea]
MVKNLEDIPSVDLMTELLRRAPPSPTNASFSLVLQQECIEKIRTAVEREGESKMDRWKEKSCSIKVEEEEVQGLRQSCGKRRGDPVQLKKPPKLAHKGVQTMELHKRRRSLQNEVTYISGSSSGSYDDDSAFNTLDQDKGSSLSSPASFIGG